MEESIPGQDSKRDPSIEQKAALSWGGRHFDVLFKYFSSLSVSVQVIKAPEYHYTYVNPAACTLMGKNSEAFLGQHVSTIVPQAQLADFIGVLDNVCKTGTGRVIAEIPSTFGQEGQTHSGYFTITYQPLRLTENEIGGVIVNTMDVTEQVCARLALKESEERLRIALECADLGTWDFDLMSGDLKLDDRFKALAGISATVQPDVQQLLSQVHADDRHVVKSGVEAALVGSSGKYEQEFRIIHGFNGNINWVHVRGQVSFDSKGTACRFFGAILEVRTSKAASLSTPETGKAFGDELTHIREELAGKNSLMETVLDTSNELIGLYDRDTRIVYFNKKTLALFELRKEDVLGKTFLEVFPKAMDSSSHQLLLRAIAGETILDHGHQSGLSGRFYKTALAPLRNKKGDVFAVLAMSYDVTDSQDALAKVNDINLALQSVNLDLEQFAFLASHDLQEPLRKIEVFSNLLYKTNHLNIDQKGLDYMAKISSSARRMSDLVKGLLEYSRITRDQSQFTTVDLNEIISEVVLDVELTIEQKKAVVECSGLPHVQAIKLQMQRLFYNLIANSLKFTSLQQPRIEINCAPVSEQEMTRFKLNPDREYVQTIVKDNGIGFRREDADKIFDMFHRLHVNEFPGTGIGLSVCKKIVDNHQGIIYADARVNGGAAFHIILPVQQNF